MHDNDCPMADYPLTNTYLFCLCDVETPLERAVRVADNPDKATDSDKLRNVADWLDFTDPKLGYTGTQAQDFLRNLADRLER